MAQMKREGNLKLLISISHGFWIFLSVFVCIFVLPPHRTIPRYVELRLIFRSVFEDFTHLNTHTP